MLNKEKYMDELMKYACRKLMESGFAALKAGGLADCCSTACGKCKFCNNAEDCVKARMEWLEQEYVEPPVDCVDWSKVPVDTPILVRDCENREWTRRHFARYMDGKVLAWRGGTTSWSESDREAISWKYAKPAESEEQA